MVLAMVLALAGTDPAASATPPPTIITTKSSPLCKAVRDVIAPVMFGLQTQDRGIQHGHALLNDLAKVSLARNMPSWVALDDMRLMNDVDHIAANNIKIHQLLDQLDALDIHDPLEKAEVRKLQATLRNVADHQADALNEFSGAADTQELIMLASFKSSMWKEGLADDKQPKAPTAWSHEPTLIDSTLDGQAATGVSYIQYVTGQAELAVAPALEPVINRCK